jgi:hypothetical protein
VKPNNALPNSWLQGHFFLCAPPTQNTLDSDRISLFAINKVKIIQGKMVD